MPASCAYAKRLVGHPAEPFSERPRIACAPKVPFRYLNRLHRQANTGAGAGEAVGSVAPTGFSDGHVASLATTHLVSAGALDPPLVTSFEPQLPDASVLAAQGLVLALTVAAAGYWWLVVVPSERAALGRSKRLGALNSYLEELERPQPEPEPGRWCEAARPARAACWGRCRLTE
jgi:hypothetical protein